MGRQIQSSSARTWRTNDEQAWLSTLVDAMEAVSRPELRTIPCDGHVLVGLRAQLALPASVRYGAAGALRH